MSAIYQVERGAKADQRMPVGREAPNVFGALLVCALLFGALLTGCGGPGEEGSGNGPDAVARSAERIAEPSPGVAQAAAARVDEASIRERLDHLTGASPAPLAGGEDVIFERGSESGRRATAGYIKESFEAMGIPARILEFDLDDGRGFNVEATLEGAEGGKHLWVSAHLDSVYNAGASDDASGLVSMLETANALRRLDLEHTVHFVAYDLEEIGLYGSARYVRDVVSNVREREGEEAIIGNINSDMVGYDEGGFEAVMGSCNKAGNIDEAVLSALEAIDSPINLTDDCLARSDHQNFWDAGYPAIILTDSTKYDDYPWYHRSGDTVDKLNITYLHSMIQLTAATAALLAAPETKADI